MTRYRVRVARELLKDRPWNPVKGFRLISEYQSASPDVSICVFEDDTAPAELEGLLIDPILQKDDAGNVTVISRTVIH